MYDYSFSAFKGKRFDTMGMVNLCSVRYKRHLFTLCRWVPYALVYINQVTDSVNIINDVSV